MADLISVIDAALLSEETLPKDKVLLWIEGAADLLTLSKLYRLTDEGYYRIQPELGRDATCALIQRYLLECIRQNVSEHEEILDRWEAARTLHMWFCHLGEKKETSAVLKSAAEAVTELYIQSAEEIRVAIEQGFLEHVLEMIALRPYFEHWSHDDRLKAAWDRALKWGEAHPNYTWGLLQEIRKR